MDEPNLILNNLHMLESTVYNIHNQLEECKALILFQEEHNKSLMDALKEYFDYNISSSEKNRDVMKLEKKLDVIFEIQRNAHADICKLLDDCQNKNGPGDIFLKSVDKKVAAIQQEYSKGMHILQEALHSAQVETRNLKEELKKKVNEINDFKIKIKMHEELNRKNRIVLNQYFTEEMKLKECILDLESSVSELKIQLNLKTTDIENLNKANKELLSKISNLQEETNDIRENFEKVKSDAKSCINFAKQSIYAKRTATYREEKVLQSYENLRSSINVELENVRKSYTSEINELKGKHSEEIKLLKEKNNNLHQELVETRCYLERSVEEKKRITSQLEKLKKDIDLSVPLSDYDTVNKKLLLAEKARNDAFTKVEAYERKIKNLEHEACRNFKNYNSNKDVLSRQIERLKALYEETVEQQKRIEGLSINMRQEYKIMHTENIKLKQELYNKNTELENYVKRAATAFYLNVTEFDTFVNIIHMEINSKWMNAMHKISCILKTIISENLKSS